MTESVLPRGIRNKNPLNIRRNSIVWSGLATDQADSAFNQFDDARYGYRAAAKILRSYKRRGINTIYEIINTWAPSSENDSYSYVQHVLKQTAWPSTYMPSESDYPKLFRIMAIHENGAIYAGHESLSVDFIAQGVRLA